MADSRQRQRGDAVARGALNYEPILRRDPTVNMNMQKWIKQQVKAKRRGIGRPEEKQTEIALAKKAAMLRRLGLDKRVSESAPWHIEHMKEGDVFKGSFTHPQFSDGYPTDITITVGPEGETATIVSAKADFDMDASVKQDFPIRIGEAKNGDMAEYCLHKLNTKWRTFSEPVPSRDEMSHMSLTGLRLFFDIVAQVKDYPSEEEFAAGCADPEKGMTKEEFLNYLHEDDPEYLTKSFIGVYTGRRLRLECSPFTFDGDFEREMQGMLFGYVEYNGVAGGTFTVQLQ